MPDAEAAKTVQTNDVSATDDDLPTYDRRVMFFGHDLTKIPCMRSSLLNGYIGAVIGGLAGFFYTSKVKFGCHSAFASYWIVATGTWIICRYKSYKKNKFWDNLKKRAKAKDFEKDGYILPSGIRKLTEDSGSSGITPVKGSDKSWF